MVIVPYIAFAKSCGNGRQVWLFREVLSMAAHPLEELLHPRAIAVVGASNNVTHGPDFFGAMRKLNFQGQLYPVNPRHSEILGVKAYASVKDIPGVVDYVISSIPASQVLGMIADSAEKGVRVIHLFTARFSETGRREAAELEQEILRLSLIHI